MAYFIPSYLQKRLLRYALSRLEILDTDALDLSSLDIAWGSRSTVELRDVGLRNNKLGPLLQLPSHVHVESTSVALIRLTVPADLYTSSIIIEIENVTAKAKVESTRETNKTKPTQLHTPASSRTNRDRFAESDELLDAQHLAHSFLEQESDDEREELEAIVAAQSVDLQQSVSSDSTGDEETNAGTGVGLSLPTFLASFLKGIGDRLQINVNDVSIKLFIEATEDSSSSPMAVSLKIDRISVHEATSKTAQGHPDVSDGKHTSIAHGGRFIKLTSVRASALTDTVGLAGFPSAADKSQLGKESQSPTQTWSPSAISRSGTEVSEGAISFASSARPLNDESFDPFVPDRSIDSLGSRFADADDNLPQSSFYETDTGSVGHSQEVGNIVRPNAGSLNTIGDLSANLHRSLETFRQEKQDRSSHNVEQGRSSRYSLRSSSSSRASSSGKQTPTNRLRDDTSSEYAHQSTSGIHAKTQDSLTESRLFSHTDAESIYMSIAEATPGSTTQHYSLPGAWADTSAYDDLEMAPNDNVQLPVTAATEHPLSGDALLQFKNSGELTTPVSGAKVDPTPTSLRPAETESQPRSAHNLHMMEIHLFYLDRAEILIPSPSGESTNRVVGAPTTPDHTVSDPMSTSASMSMSSINAIPGAFSSYADITSRKRGISSRPGRSDSGLSSTYDIKRPETNGFGSSIEVTLGKITSQIDVNTVPFLNRVFRKLHGIFNSETAEKAKVRREYEVERRASTSPLASLTIQALAIRIVGPDSVEPSPEDNPQTRGNESQPDHLTPHSPIFVLSLDKISLLWSESLGAGSGEFTVHSITCDIAGQRTLSFDREATLGTSMRGAHAPVNDLSITYGQTRGSPEISVVTLPVIFDLDFHKVDDTFSSFGGFSGLIELGSSILSDPESPHPAMPPSERPRAVRFDSGVKPSRSETDTGNLRFNVRVNGGLVILRGLKSTIRCRSSAIKLVTRDSGIGLQIDEIVLDAPYVKHQSSSLQLNLRNLGLKYLARPEEHDLSRLISLLTPSKDKFEEADDFLLDTLVRQRKKGAAMRLNIGVADLRCSDLDSIQKIQAFVIELTKLSVTKYLPEESRPGLLTLALISKVQMRIDDIPKLGDMRLDLLSAEFAHIGAPSLIAIGIQGLSLKRGNDQSILKEVFPSSDPTQPPMVMARFIGDEMEPTVKVKLWNIVFEYSVPLAEMLLGLGNTDPNVNVAADLTASLANLTDARPIVAPPKGSPGANDSSVSQTKSPKLDLSLRDCALALNPHKLPSRALLVLTQARLDCAFPRREDLYASLDIRKASLLLIDDAQKLLDPDSVHQEAAGVRLVRRDQLSDLGRQGYVSMSWISAATIEMKLTRSKGMEPNVLEVGIGDELLVIEACADSTATLGDLFGALTPKLSPPKGDRYRTEIVSMQDMMASFTGDAFAVKPEESRVSFEDAHDVANFLDDDTSSDLDAYDEFPDLEEDEPFTAENEDDIYQYSQESTSTTQPQQSQASLVAAGEMRDFESISGGVHLTQMGPQISPFAKKWDSTNNRYLHLSPSELAQSAIRIQARDVHVIWNLYDGYDWEKTRNVITKAVQEVQTKAEERRMNRRTSREALEEEESVIGDFLFNSIYIGIPANHDPRELTQQINRDVDDMMTETGSHTSTTVTAKPSSSSRPLRQHGKKLRLQRSKRHKIAFELRGLSADYFSFPPSGETQSSLDVRVKDFEIYDHVPTSTWKKFLTYMHDAGPREDKKPMIHLEICDVRPVPELIASELVVRATVLPVRLHVDQDALDFMTRYFAFNESTSSTSGPSPAPSSTAQPYLQRVEVYPVPLKLDYKPKRVDYAGIRSGRTNEFKNFFVLDGAEMVLKHAIIYGTSGFDKLHHSLEDVWTPDIIRNQLPSVLSGLGGVRTLVNVGAGMRDLVVVPVREYQKDGRIVRSISKGAMAFARSTGGEITRFGAKLAVGAQTALQGAEDFLTAPQAPASSVDRDWEEAELDESEKRAVSHYADQPAGFVQGLRGAARSLERDLLLTRDVIVAISGEMRESDTAGSAARVLARHAPTLVLRPMIGASKAIGQTLMGANNSVDPANRRRVEDKYKRY